jgi:outer membrane lipase/esterase
VWIEYLASSLGRPQDAAPVFLAGPGAGNYAIGGARASVWPGDIIPTTAAQIARYFSFAGAADPTGLYTLFSGGNDLRAAGALATDAERRAATLAAAQAVAAQAGALAANGARSILVPYLANVGLFPEALIIPGRTAILAELSTLYNQALAVGIGQLRAANPTTTFYDLRLDNLYDNVRFDALARGGATYGITNVNTPCFAPGAPSCATSLFVDGQHPTTVGHQAIAGAARNLVVNGVNVSTVPEPTTVALLGGGLLLVAGAAARRRARTAA